MKAEEGKRRGDTETRGHGDAETRGRGDTETRGHGDAGTRGHGDTATRLSFILHPSSFINGYIGLAIIIAAEALLFSGNEIVGAWFTPIVWTGYILFIDGIVYKLQFRSLLINERVELLIMVFISIAGWWLFEFYNAPRFWHSHLELWWHYQNLAPNPYLRRFGYDWAFATIFPALFLTAQLFATTIFKNLGSYRPIRFSQKTCYLMILIGAAGAILPLVVISSWFAPVIWLSFIFLLDPINYLRGWPSIVGDIAQANYQRLFSLLASGGVCGLLWEFWNYWAISKWTYTVPYFGNVKVFDMPVLGYLGFPPFAVECWVMYIFFRSLLTTKFPQLDGNQTNIWIEQIDLRAGSKYAAPGVLVLSSD